MPQLKYYNTDKQKWDIVKTDGNNVYFEYGQYGGRTLIQVIDELKAIIAGGAITRNTLNCHLLNIEADGQKEVLLPLKINPNEDSFILFLNSGVLSPDLYSLNKEGDLISFTNNLNLGDVLYLVIFKTVRMTPPDTYDGIILSEGSIQESKLGPALQRKINDTVSSNFKNITVSETEPNEPKENDIWIVI